MVLNTGPLDCKSSTLTTGPKSRAQKIQNPKVFIDYSQTTDDVYENLEDYNPTNKRKVLIVFDDMRADIEANMKLSSIVTELFLRGIKIKISLVFMSKSFILIFTSIPRLT